MLRCFPFSQQHLGNKHGSTSTNAKDVLPSRRDDRVSINGGYGDDDDDVHLPSSSVCRPAVDNNRYHVAPLLLLVVIIGSGC